jgi:arylsulfatase A-like enzyme
VPFIARWPAQIKPRVSNQIFSLVDLFATLGDITGQTVPHANAVDSLDLSSVLLGATTNQVRDNTVLHGVSDTLALRWHDWKYIPANTNGKPTGMGHGADPSQARFASNHITKPMLFDLATDPGESTNLFGSHPEIAAAMQRKLGEIKNATPKVQ